MLEILKEFIGLIFKPPQRTFIINSLLDLDIYKIYMAYFIWKFYHDVHVSYSLTNRTAEIKLANHVSISELNRQLYHIKNLQLTIQEIDDLKKKLAQSGIHFDEDFFSTLLNLIKSDFQISTTKNGQLEIRIEGEWLTSILYETMVLALINELYFRRKLQNVWQRFFHYSFGLIKLLGKIFLLWLYPGIKFVHFGTRRRLSYDWEDFIHLVLTKMVRKNQFIGISNVLFSIKYHKPVLGTNAHELYMAITALASQTDEETMRVQYAKILQQWLDLFGATLSVALTDTFTTEFFFKIFTAKLAQKYRALRQDSGSPDQFAEMAIDFYQSMNIKPQEKSIIFSDALDIWIIIRLWKKFHEKIQVLFGWGTNLTNDVGFKTLSIVIKIKDVLINNRRIPTVKLSDNPAKAIGDPETLKEYARIFNPRFFEQRVEKCKY